MQRYLGHYLFTILSFLIALFTGAFLPVITGMAEFGHFTDYISIPFFITGFITFYFDLLESRKKDTQPIVDGFRRVGIGVIIYFLFAFFWETKIEQLFILIPMLFYPSFLLHFLKFNTRNLYVALIVNFFLTLFWIVMWQCHGSFNPCQYLLKEVVYCLILFYLYTTVTSSPHMVDSNDKSFDLKVLITYALIDQGKLWFPLFIVSSNHLLMGETRVLLSLVYGLINLLPLNLMAMEATELDRLSWIWMVFWVFVVMILITTVVIIFPELFSCAISMLNLRKVNPIQFILLLWSYTVFKVMSRRILRVNYTYLLFTTVFSLSLGWLYSNSILPQVYCFFFSFSTLILIQYVWTFRVFPK